MGRVSTDLIRKFVKKEASDRSALKRGRSARIRLICVHLRSIFRHLAELLPFLHLTSSISSLRNGHAILSQQI